MDPNVAKQAVEKGFKFVANTGLELMELKPGYVKCRMPYLGNGNHIGTMYAGALFTLAEIPGGALFLSSFDITRYFPIVKSLDLRFVKPAKADVYVEIALDAERIQAISAEADAKGKADFVLDGELKLADGTVVAVSHGVYQLRSSAPSSKAA
ncbi:MAG TPA: YiiD C-terminal domain-containing protein [Nevskiaceae bacterium]|nr:YiiD C-terminal domain-containing protein [Nevskiaceae bacterium]